MRRLGHPDLTPYLAHRHPVSEAGSLRVTWAGVATLLIDDGESAVLTDGFFSRPSLPRLVTRSLVPDEGRIAAGLRSLGVDRLEAVVPVHSHFDHVMDSPTVALRTGATLVGGTSSAHVARGGGVPEERIVTVADGDRTTHGAYELRFVATTHSPPDRFPGTIDAPVHPPVRVGAYRCGEAWAVHIGHRSGRRMLVQGSAGYVEHALDHLEAEVVMLGVGQLGVLPEPYLRDYWRHTVSAVGARHVVLIHWDDFFRPLDRPLRGLPLVADDLDRTWRVLSGLAAADGVRLSMPPLLAPFDPWEALS